MRDPDPCTKCGACCADQQVVFDAVECDEWPYVPEAISEDVTNELRCMTGTDAASPRCVALAGEIGRAVRCGVYERRPTPCRDYLPDGEFGVDNAECTAARARHGLPPLEGSVFALKR